MAVATEVKNLNLKLNVDTRQGLKALDSFLKVHYKVINAVSGSGSQISNPFGSYTKSLNAVTDSIPQAETSVSRLQSLMATPVDGILAKGFNLLKEAVINSVEAFAEFETSLTDVRKMAGFEGSLTDLNSEFGAFGQNLRDLAVTDLRGAATVDELGQIAASAAQLGVAKEHLLGFSKDVAIASTALDISTEKTATSLSRIVKQFKLPYEDVSRVASAINEVSQNSTATTKDLLNYATRLTGSGKALGLTIDEIVGISGVLRDNIPGAVEKTSRATNSMILSLIKNQDKWINQLNLDAGKFRDALQNDGVEAIAMVAQALENVKESKGPEVLTQTIENLMGKGDGANILLLNLAGTQDALRSSTELSTKAFREDTSVLKEFAAVTSTQESKFKALKVKMHEIAIEGGTFLKPMTDFMLGTATDALDEFMLNGEEFLNFFGEEMSGGLVTNLGTGLKGLKDMVSDTFTELNADSDIFFESLKEQFTLSNILETITDGAATAYDAVHGVVSDVLDEIGKLILEKIGKIKLAILEELTGIVDSYVNFAEKIGVRNDTLTGLFQGITDKLIGVPVQRYHTGGLARDEVPAILQTGEYVLSRKHVQMMKRDELLMSLLKRYGVEFHSGGPVKYHEGGEVGHTHEANDVNLIVLDPSAGIGLDTALEKAKEIRGVVEETNQMPMITLDAERGYTLEKALADAKDYNYYTIESNAWQYDSMNILKEQEELRQRALHYEKTGQMVTEQHLLAIGHSTGAVQETVEAYEAIPEATEVAKKAILETESAFQEAQGAIKQAIQENTKALAQTPEITETLQEQVLAPRVILPSLDHLSELEKRQASIVWSIDSMQHSLRDPFTMASAGTGVQVKDFQTQLDALTGAQRLASATDSLETTALIQQLQELIAKQEGLNYFTDSNVVEEIRALRNQIKQSQVLDREAAKEQVLETRIAGFRQAVALEQLEGALVQRGGLTPSIEASIAQQVQVTPRAGALQQNTVNIHVDGSGKKDKELAQIVRKEVEKGLETTARKVQTAVIL